MSAQAGIWNFDGGPVDQTFLGKISSAIEQDGPDGRNTHIDGSLGMVYSAFHTTRESRLEHQPYKSARGNVIIWDGRLDNRDDLTRELLADAPVEQTDVALVMAAYEKWGTDCFGKLIGDWAISIWDKHEQDVVLARDCMGVRHLYYILSRKRVIWCTNLGSLVLVSDVSLTLNEEYIVGYLALYPAANLTPYREIEAVPPGKFIRIRDANVAVESYWAFDPDRKTRYKDDAEYEEHFRHVFRQAVRRRLRSDSPILAELSGGLDSSSIVCTADDIAAKEGALAPDIDTISYYDPDEPDGGDFFYFTKIEQKRGRPGIHINASEYSKSANFEVPTFCPAPTLGGGQALSTERFDMVRHAGYRVVLSGIGGDEFLGGVPDPRPQLADLIVRFQFRMLAKELVAWSFAKRRPWIHLLFESLCLLFPLPLRAYIEKETKVEPWIGSHFARRHHLAKLKLGPSKGYGFRLPSGQEYARTFVAMTRQIAYTQPSHGICSEKRYPCLDQTLLEFIISIPPNQLLRPGDRRSLMRRALVGLLPPEVLSRRTKATASRRWMVALEKDWDRVTRVFECPLISHLGYVDRVRFQEALLEMKNGKMPANLARLLKGISLELWLRSAFSQGVFSVSRSAPWSVGVDLLQSRA